MGLLLWAISAFATGRIVSLSLVEGGVLLVIETTPGRRYQVQRCENLAENVWLNEGDPFAAAEVQTVRNIETSLSFCFFRAVEIPSEPPPPSGPPPTF